MSDTALTLPIEPPEQVTATMIVVVGLTGATVTLGPVPARRMQPFVEGPDAAGWRVWFDFTNDRPGVVESAWIKVNGSSRQIPLVGSYTIEPGHVLTIEYTLRVERSPGHVTVNPHPTSPRGLRWIAIGLAIVAIGVVIQVAGLLFGR